MADYRTEVVETDVLIVGGGTGAIGAALWGAFRYEKLAKLDALPMAA